MVVSPEQVADLMLVLNSYYLCSTFLWLITGRWFNGMGIFLDFQKPFATVKWPFSAMWYNPWNWGMWKWTKYSMNPKYKKPFLDSNKFYKSIFLSYLPIMSPSNCSDSNCSFSGCHGLLITCLLPCPALIMQFNHLFCTVPCPLPLILGQPRRKK